MVGAHAVEVGLVQRAVHVATRLPRRARGLDRTGVADRGVRHEGHELLLPGDPVAPQGLALGAAVFVPVGVVREGGPT